MKGRLGCPMDGKPGELVAGVLGLSFFVKGATASLKKQ